MTRFTRTIALVTALIGLACALPMSSVSAQQKNAGVSLATTGSITTQDGVVTLDIPSGLALSTVGVDASGTWTGTITIECAARNRTSAFSAIILSPRASTTTATTFTANGQWSGTIAGCGRVQARASAAMTGEAVVTLNGSSVGGGGGAGASAEITGDVIVDTTALEAVGATTNTNLGAPGDAAATAGSTGSLNAKARLMTTQLSTLDGRVDGLETLIGTTNSSLTTIDGRVDGIETLIGTTNSTLTTIDGRVDGLEALIGTTNTTLTTIDGRVDGLEALITSSNTKIDSVATAVALLETVTVDRGTGWGTDPCAGTPSSVVIDTASSGNNQLVAISGSTVVYACGFSVETVGTVNFQFVTGTGSACATGETDKTGVYEGVAQWGSNLGFSGSTVFKGAAGEAMCIELSGAVGVKGILSYVQQ